MQRLLLPAFGSLQRDSHPWWWPAGDGSRLEHWGITAEAVADAGVAETMVLESLRMGTRSPSEKVHSSFDGFRGSLATPPEQAGSWVLCMRPSRSRWQQAKTVWLYKLLNDLQLLASTRVTDLVKFRGAAPAAAAWADATPMMQATSLACLVQEFKIAPPVRVIIAGGATRNAFLALLHARIDRSPNEESTKVLNQIHLRARPAFFYSPQGMRYDDVLRDWVRCLTENRCLPDTPVLARYRAHLREQEK